MQIIVVTGMSGSGKSLAAHYLEDMGFMCIDNMPPQMLQDLLKLLTENEKNDGTGEGKSKLAVVMDARDKFFVKSLAPVLSDIKKSNASLQIIFMDAVDEILIKRYKQTRRKHPLEDKKSLSAAIAEERKLLEPVKRLATKVLDTSNLNNQELKDLLFTLFLKDDDDNRLSVFVQSFGFKYGMPSDCDIVLDTRFLPNPFYIDELRPLSGQDAEVAAYLKQFPEYDTFLQYQKEVFEFLLPLYIREGKTILHVGVGCTGGRHRSVRIALELGDIIENLGYRVVVDHRDIERDRLSPEYHTSAIK